MNKVYIRWNPLYERVVCVHTNEDESCPACDKAREDVKNTGYFLGGDWFEVDMKYPKKDLPKKIKLEGSGGCVGFTLSDKRKFSYYGRTEDDVEYKWRNFVLEDNEVYYETEWGWGVIVDSNTMIVIHSSFWEGQKAETVE